MAGAAVHEQKDDVLRLGGKVGTFGRERIAAGRGRIAAGGEAGGQSTESKPRFSRNWRREEAVGDDGVLSPTYRNSFMLSRTRHNSFRR